ncbi:MFS transporter [Dorea sp. D27]|uniref:MFS transporter n=1 Tax=Dorea sp. D27 TaxID=658665 RepID=UPI000673A02C|nr:MFS transporter [Dorea sp. D27]KMZ54406.1 transporter, major facilitator family [Dorea sp. D27]
MKKIKNRYIILLIAATVNFVHGNPYIWTVFQPHVKAEYNLSLAASSQPFTIIIGIFAVGNMIGGYLQHKIGSRATILGGSFVMCAGFFLAAVAPAGMPWMISAGYGLLGGLGSGCAFSMLVAVPQQWFPDKRGLVTGITVGIVGISGVVMNPFCDWLLAHHGYRYAMLAVTGIYAVLSLGGIFISEPDAKPAGDGEGSAAETVQGKQYTTKEMFRTKTYYLLSISMALAVPAYVLVNPLMKSLGMERGLTDSAALIGVVAASGANIAGRFAAPWMSDFFGRKTVIQVLYATAMISVIGLTVAKGGLFILLISLVSLTYGGFVSVFPVLTSDCFGMKYQGMNFGAVMLGYGVVSILCPYLLAAVQDTPLGTNLSFIIAGGICIIGMAATARIRVRQD